MNIAAYHPWVYLKGGSERTLLELMRRSRHHWTLFTNHYDRQGTFPDFADLDVRPLGSVSVQRTLRHVAGAGLRVLTQQLPLRGASALMISSEGLGNLVTIRSQPVPTFCFCHTPLKVAYDPFTRDRILAERPRLLTQTAIGLYTLVDRLGWRQYQRVFCNSREVANRVLGARLVDPARVEINHPGVDLRRFDASGPFEPFFLLAGRIARTKTIELGIDAFLQMKSIQPATAGFRLVIAGMVDAKSQSYFEAMQQRASVDPSISFIIEPSDTVLSDLYRRCYCALFTALNEDWGLVPLEAMASGKPVIAVGRGGPIESIVNRQTGLHCPAEPAAFAAAMASLATQPAWTARLGRQAREHVTRFSWDAFVERIDEYAENLVAERATGRSESHADWRRRRVPSA